ncbi:L-serine deaminase I [Campylobacter iguaniorum]|uniref:L-serine dehydratase n=1 Tax=Campylobacter iguaniorum TaxID=1244531 RepID=A0A076F7X8_9BACT|nr:L-serine ammonia-lyase [Campylobacter iguaniorum]AII14146.1 L-serine deaminase I [Campylobacter iguaniorum]ALV23885.1 L-serine deaminase I [Campylobacter iguaniorum]
MSNLSIFKIGVGPSSSHTLGVMIGANLFCQKAIDEWEKYSQTARIQTKLYGSLSLTGKGHLSDSAIIWGLNNIKAKELTPTIQKEILAHAMQSKKIKFAGLKDIKFNYETDMIFSKEFLCEHQNGFEISAFDDLGNLLGSQIYFSVGGGFVKTIDEMNAKAKDENKLNLAINFNNAKDILNLCSKHQWNLPKLSLEYELQFNSPTFIKDYCLEIWEVMQSSYANGIHPKNDYLPGRLHLKRRAKGLNERLSITSDPLGVLDYISLYAIAVAEENAGGGRVVTAPTNGACAVIPAVMLYLKNHTIGFNDDKVIEFLLSAMLIGSLYKKNASISGAEAGCQAEIGSASSMSAAAMASVMGADAIKSCNAAEVAMEHHLGLTCDPVYGLVQIPCIERNAFGAIKAISAARMAMSRKSDPKVSLDNIIKTMFETGKDMSLKYKETALGGLAVTLGSVC